MKSASCRDMENMRPESPVQNEIIYLYTPRKSAKRGGKGGDVFWNIFFAVMCLSVLVILFLN